MSQTVIRMATIRDADEINAIYEPYIKNTAITFEYESVSSEEFKGRMESILQKLPYLVCEVDGEIAGYAYVAPFKERAAFAWDLEITVYLKESYQRRNIGTAMYQALFKIAKVLGYINIYAFITHPNEKSRKMHESLGFHQVGLYPETGYKFDRWWGLNVMCKRIGSVEEKPLRTKNIQSMSQTELDHIFHEASKMINAR